MAVSNEDRHLFRGHFAQVKCVGVPFWSAPGFAIPLFQWSPNANTNYVQRVDGARRITGFDEFEEHTRTVPLESTCRAKIGDREIFALLDPSSVVHAGTRAKLSPMVKSWVAQVDAPLLRMSFARFCGEGGLADRAAVEAVKMKASEFNSEEQAVRWFVDAVVLAELLTTLAASSGEERRKVRNTDLETARVAVRLSGKLRIQIEVPRTLLQRDDTQIRNYRTKLAKLLRLVHAATGREVDILGVEDAKDFGPPREVAGVRRESAADRLLAAIRQCSRQEERLALLMGALISDGAAAWKVLENYSDDTAFAENATSYLRKTLHPGTDSHDITRRIEIELPAIIAIAYPRQRGKLLLALARVLGRYPPIAKVIRDKVHRSNSRDVAIVRDIILNELG